MLFLKKNHFIEFWYNTYREIEMDIDKDMWMKIFTLFKRFEPEVVIKLNIELEKFTSDYDDNCFYSNSQKIVISYLLKKLFSKKRNCFYITGNAGTGKSFLLRQLVRLFEDVLNYNALVWASIGTAAININGTSVHRAFMIYLYNVAAMWMSCSSAYQSLKKTDFVIIDEISMIQDDIIASIDLILSDIQMDKGSWSDE